MAQKTKIERLPDLPAPDAHLPTIPLDWRGRSDIINDAMLYTDMIGRAMGRGAGLRAELAVLRFDSLFGRGRMPSIAESLAAVARYDKPSFWDVLSQVEGAENAKKAEKLALKLGDDARHKAWAQSQLRDSQGKA